MTLSLFAETFKHSGKFLASAVVLQHEASSQHINQVLPTFNFLLSIYSNSGEMGQWIFQFVVEYDTTIIHHRMLSTHHKRYFLICIVGVFSKSLKNNFVNCKLTHNYGPYGCFFNLMFQMKKNIFDHPAQQPILEAKVWETVKSERGEIYSFSSISYARDIYWSWFNVCRYICGRIQVLYIFYMGVSRNIFIKTYNDTLILY